jgi:hypothetical protein
VIPGNAVLVSIETLKLRIGDQFIQNHEWICFAEHEYLRNLAPSLVNLQTLSVTLSSTLAEDFEAFENVEYSFDNLLVYVAVPSITSFSITSKDMISRASQEIGPFRSLVQFPNLRQVVAPHTALMVRYDSTACKLPALIETIQVVGGTEDFIEHLRDALRDERQFPTLPAVIALPDQET